MKLAVFSHKPCWRSDVSPSGYATDGGFPMQMSALSELFDATVLVVPCIRGAPRPNGTPLVGQNLTVAPLSHPPGVRLRRKMFFPLWTLRNARTLLRESGRSDAVHTPIPGDIGTVGIILAWLFARPLFVRYCNNWSVQRTVAERCWHWFMEKRAGGRNVMLATGGGAEPPSARNPEVRWIFSSSLTMRQLDQCAAVRQPVMNGRHRLITVGRQESGKGTDTVLRSLALLRKKLPGATLDVVGDGTALPELRRLADSLGISGRARFHGAVAHAEVLRLLQRADLFCFPTASEGFPKAVLEALACGLPVVTTRVSVLPQLVGNRCGLLIDEATPFAMAEGIQRCLADGRFYARMSKAAVATARRYSLEKWRDAIGRQLETAWGELRTHGRPR